MEYWNGTVCLELGREQQRWRSDQVGIHIEWYFDAA